MARFQDSDLNQFRKAIVQGLPVNAICGGLKYRVTSIGKQSAKTISWWIPLGKIHYFEIDRVASLGF